VAEEITGLLADEVTNRKLIRTVPEPDKSEND